MFTFATNFNQSIIIYDLHPKCLKTGPFIIRFARNVHSVYDLTKGGKVVLRMYRIFVCAIAILLCDRKTDKTMGKIIRTQERKNNDPQCTTQ